MDCDPTLLGGSVAFAAAAAFGSVVSIRHDVPGEPLGLRVDLPVPAGLLVGWGAGVAAPWPMPVAALVAAAKGSRFSPRTAPGWVCGGLGAGCIVGTLVEPVTYKPWSSMPAVRMAIVINLATSSALAAAGLRYAMRA
jgi:hypothetical protein